MKGGFVLVGLVLTAVGTAACAVSGPIHVPVARAVHGFLEAVEAPPGRLAVQGVGLRQ